MTNKFNIPIEGLPEGWEVQKVTVEENGVKCTWKEGKRMTLKAEIKLKKSKPRRIVLEETEEYFSEGDSGHAVFNGQVHHIVRATIEYTGNKIWREVKEGE